MTRNISKQCQFLTTKFKSNHRCQSEHADRVGSLPSHRCVFIQLLVIIQIKIVLHGSVLVKYSNSKCTNLKFIILIFWFWNLICFSSKNEKFSLCISGLIFSNSYPRVYKENALVNNSNAEHTFWGDFQNAIANSKFSFCTLLFLPYAFLYVDTTL